MKISLQHIHLITPNKQALGEWYCFNLGFKVVDDLEKLGESNGPLLISSDDGITGLSIFNARRKPENIFAAYGTSSIEFIQLHEKFSQPPIYDHYRFFSFYIKDLDGNSVEICCTDYTPLKARFDQKNIRYIFMTPDTYTPPA